MASLSLGNQYLHPSIPIMEWGVAEGQGGEMMFNHACVSRGIIPILHTPHNGSLWVNPMYG